MELIDQKRKGLLPEHRGLALLLPQHRQVRLTIQAREALEVAGAEIAYKPMDLTLGVPTYTVRLVDRVPADLVAVFSAVAMENGREHQLFGLRLENEPPYPREIGRDFWLQVEFTPCPHCGAPLMWYEAAFVPGYRVCTKKPHHHWITRRLKAGSQNSW